MSEFCTSRFLMMEAYNYRLMISLWNGPLLLLPLHKGIDRNVFQFNVFQILPNCCTEGHSLISCRLDQRYQPRTNPGLSLVSRWIRPVKTFISLIFATICLRTVRNKYELFLRFAGNACRKIFFLAKHQGE